MVRKYTIFYSCMSQYDICNCVSTRKKKCELPVCVPGLSHLSHPSRFAFHWLFFVSPFIYIPSKYFIFFLIAQSLYLPLSLPPPLPLSVSRPHTLFPINAVTFTTFAPPHWYLLSQSHIIVRHEHAISAIISHIFSAHLFSSRASPCLVFSPFFSSLPLTVCFVVVIRRLYTLIDRFLRFLSIIKIRKRRR